MATTELQQLHFLYRHLGIAGYGKLTQKDLWHYFDQRRKYPLMDQMGFALNKDDVWTSFRASYNDRHELVYVCKDTNAW